MSGDRRPAVRRPGPPPARSLEEQLGWTLERLGTWLIRVTPPDEWGFVARSVIDRLIRHGPMRVSELVAEERMSQPGMTGLLGRMAAAGLVTRGSDPTDGRATLVSVTQAGIAYLDDRHRRRPRIIADRLSELGPGRRAALVAAAEAMDALARTGPEGPDLGGAGPDLGAVGPDFAAGPDLGAAGPGFEQEDAHV